ncbi:head maturation protease, ClpP-related [Gracilibacillus dipsosauri]|uniref:ATP-dependent Clp protease proteolytic subunit n=1 Tax=Gracilibacillus dipsosauri TaxID=178340 RepID=A0A317KXR3_9BACI|nr:head maturation protease, ClpP-related [Gracilibacillus dipsosauri]PWU68311.1 peptidase [Gracilibacillus dipsosauri]
MPYKLKIKGTIVSDDIAWIYELFDIDHTSPRMVETALENANGDHLEILINSPGGSVFDGSEIYSTIKDYSGDSTVKIVGIAASAASVIAMAGKKVMMAPTAQMMIHNASTFSSGDYREMDKTSDFLKNVNQTIANAYKIKSGKTDEELLSMMDDETWMTAQQAMEHNMIDEIMFDDSYQTVAAVDSVVLPKQVIDKVRSQGGLNKPTNTKNAIDEEIVKQMLADFKEEIINELQPNNQQTKAPVNKKPKRFL